MQNSLYINASCVAIGPYYTRTPMAAKKEIKFFILFKLSIKHHNFKIFLAQSKYVHCQFSRFFKKFPKILRGGFSKFFR